MIATVTARLVLFKKFLTQFLNNMKYEKLIKNNIKIHPRGHQNGWKIEIERPEGSIMSKYVYRTNTELKEAMNKAIDYELERIEVIRLFNTTPDNSTKQLAAKSKLSYDQIDKILNNYLKNKNK